MSSNYARPRPVDHPTDDRSDRLAHRAHVHGGSYHHEAHEQPKDRGEPNSAATFVMCPPTYLSTKIANNVFMKGKQINKERALNQYARAVNIMEALDVEILEIPPVPGCQDQVYTANLAIAIEPYIVIAHYKAPGRDCEVQPAKNFFRKLGYKQIIQPPFHWEGEADLKKWKDGVYFGGYGQFSDIRAHRWIEEKTQCEIIPLREVNEKLYHLDCSLLIVDEENFLVAREGLAPESIKVLEKCGNVTFTPPHVAETGATNCVLIPEQNICLSGMFQPEDKNYRKGMEFMNSTFDKFGFTCIFLDVDEFDSSGADLSCCVMRLTF